MTSNINEIIALDPGAAKREEILVEDYYTQFETFPNQRDHLKKSRTKKWQQKMLRPHQDHYEVKGVECGCDIVNPINPNQVFKKGTKLKTDGHTTAEFFARVCPDDEKLSKLIPRALQVTWHMVYTWDELQDAFNVFDNNKSVKDGSDKFFGAARINELTITNFDKVQSIASLEYASALIFPQLYTKGAISSANEANRMMKDIGKGFVWLDQVISLNEFGSIISLNPLLKCVYVMSYMYYSLDFHGDDAREKSLKLLQEFVIDVSNDAVDSKNRGKGIDCCSMFIQKWKEITMKSHPHTFNNNLNRTSQSTNTIAFALMMIDDYISGQKRQQYPKMPTIDTYINKWQLKYKIESGSLVSTILKEPVEEVSQ